MSLHFSDDPGSDSEGRPGALVASWEATPGSRGREGSVADMERAKEESTDEGLWAQRRPSPPVTLRYTGDHASESPHPGAGRLGTYPGRSPGCYAPTPCCACNLRWRKPRQRGQGEPGLGAGGCRVPRASPMAINQPGGGLRGEGRGLDSRKQKVFQEVLLGSHLWGMGRKRERQRKKFVWLQ